MVVGKLSRHFFIALSKNKLLTKGARRWGLRLGASQVVAGTTIESVVQTVRTLNEQGLVCTVDHLGEFVSTKEEARAAAEVCIQTLEALDDAGVDSQLSVKLTQLGLDIDQELCLHHMKRIVRAAEAKRNFVQIDMEDYSRREATLEILAGLRESHENVGTAIQAYLHCAADDLRMLEGVPLRLVKGAYKEPKSVAFQQKSEIDDNFLRIIKQHLDSGSYTAIASHDHRIIKKVKDYCREQRIPRSQYEFQMLYGFRPGLQREIAAQGYRMRVYVPYGEDWYGYFMRRLAERPQNVAFALRGFFKK
ncbi:proline dehydrogenase [Alkalihalobacillus oceani]|uniref:proline dehydrogenase family protein n=1 Tax=Halalkalibacter oceani TaxID=1653776 RepID=UPI00203C3978|nr:proline dehydrogenase [Halalkalibacter oceani]MCM3761733.1 proline dehydrogenase [Halalkalibacter oceani]